MKHVLIVATLVALAGCPSDNDGRTLFIAPDRVETQVKLITQEPPPF